MPEYIFNFNEYKKKIKKSTNFNWVFTIVFIIFLLGLNVFFKTNFTPNYNFYFVEIDCVKSFSKANKIANELCIKNGAGFIYFDNNYHVLAGFYKDETSAKTVAENIANEFKNAKIFSISVSKSATKNAKFNKGKNQIDSLISTLFEIENSLYETSILVETENTNFKTINTKLITLYDKYLKVFDDFKSAFAENNSAYNILKKAKTIQTSLFDLTQTAQHELAQKLRYETVNIAVNHSMILNELA